MAFHKDGEDGQDCQVNGVKICIQVRQNAWTVGIWWTLSTFLPPPSAPKSRELIQSSEHQLSVSSIESRRLLQALIISAVLVSVLTLDLLPGQQNTSILTDFLPKVALDVVRIKQFIRLPRPLLLIKLASSLDSFNSPII